MTTYLRHSACAVVGLALLATAPMTGQEPTRLGNFASLRFTVSIPAREFVALEPIPVTLRLENNTDVGVRGHSVLEFSAGRVSLIVQADGGPPSEVEQLSVLTELVGTKGRVLKPGESREVTELLDFNLDKALPKAGRYTLQFLLRGLEPGEPLRSNAVSVVIRDANGVEQAAQQYIRESGAPSHFFTGLSNGSLFHQLEELALLFTGTIYAAYAELRLGEINEARGNRDAARRHLSTVAEKTSFPLAGRAAERLKRLQQ